MSKKRASLTCDHLEELKKRKELMYLHEVWPEAREWQTIKKARLVFFCLFGVDEYFLCVGSTLSAILLNVYIDQHVRRDVTGQRHKYTSNF